MRIVRHPNVVELKAFYYSNGDRVSVAAAAAAAAAAADPLPLPPPFTWHSCRWLATASDSDG